MKKVLNVLCLWGAATVALTGTMGCKMAASEVNQEAPPEPAAEPPATVSIARLLNPRIVPAGEDPALPDASLDLGSERRTDAAVFQDAEVQFTDNVLMGTRPLFLVWAKDIASVPILSAVVDHRLVDQNNQEVGEVTRLPAWSHPSSQHWYVPLKELVGGALSDIDPAYQHLVHLDLVFATGDRQVLTVRFRAIGELARPAVSVVDSVVRPVGQDWSLKKVRLRNPANRAVRVKVESRSELKLRSFLSRKLARQRARYEMPEFYQKPYFAEASIDLLLRLKRAGEFQPTEDIFLLGARETVELQWIATPRSAPQCSLPATESVSYSWLVDFGGVTAMSVAHPAPWSLDGAAVAGRWSAHLVAFNPWESAAQGVRVKHLEENLEATPPGGADSEERLAMDCQGLF